MFRTDAKWEAGGRNVASKKQRRKAARRAKAEQRPTGTSRHPDGDRRRRGGTTYEQGLAIKRMLQQPAPEPPPADKV
jgi:hypothetical protein